MSHCTDHWDNAQILYRGYFTPYKLANIYPDHSPLCWRHCSTGNLFHVLWGFKCFCSFWNAVFSLTSKILGIISKPSPHPTLLNLSIDKYPWQFRTIVLHILIAKVVITKKLNPIKPLQYQKWYILSILTLSMTGSLQVTHAMTLHLLNLNGQLGLKCRLY